MTINRRRFLFNAGLVAAGAVSASGLNMALALEPKISDDLSSWEGIRRQFALAPDYVHLSGFFLASHPKPVREAIENYRRALDDNPFLYVENNAFATPSIEDKIQASVAEYLGGKPEEVALTDSTTMGLALVYHGLPLKAGDEILLTVHDHYSHHESARLAAERMGATVRKIALFDDFKSISEAEIVNRIKKGVSAKTRVVGVTWVHSSSGLKLPIRNIAAAIAEINKTRNEQTRVFLVVDGVHGFGVEDENAAQMGADFFVAGTHKWILGPRGTGIIWGKAENWKLMRPVIPSFAFGPYDAWMMNRKPEGMQASWMTPGGFHSFEHWWALPAAFALHKQIGKTRVAERIHALNEQAKEELARMPKVKLYTPRGNKLSAGLICFDVEGIKPEAVAHKLLEKRIIASVTPYGTAYARIAPSLMNTPEEIEATLSHIRAMA